MRFGLICAAMLLALGCADDGFDQGPIEETDSLLPPPDEPAPGSIPLGDPCSESNDCSGPGICAAPFDGDGGALVCTDACVPSEDSTQWCADDEACCDGDAICGPRGLCQVPVAVDETGASETGMASTGADGGDTTVGMSSSDGTATSSEGSSGMASTGGSSTGT